MVFLSKSTPFFLVCFLTDGSGGGGGGVALFNQFACPPPPPPPCYGPAVLINYLRHVHLLVMSSRRARYGAFLWTGERADI